MRKTFLSKAMICITRGYILCLSASVPPVDEQELETNRRVRESRWLSARTRRARNRVLKSKPNKPRISAFRLVADTDNITVYSVDRTA